MVLRFLLQLLLVTVVTAEFKPLPRYIIATHYALDISINMPAANQTLSNIVGTVQPAMVQIFFKVLKATDKIYLNAENLIFSEILIRNENGTSDYAEMSYTYIDDDQLLGLKSPYLLTLGGRYSLNISYGYITQTAPTVNYGLFFSNWTDENNKTRYVAGTHFEPISARKMMPCLDDPSYRATWQVTVDATPGYSVSSNTKRISLTKSRHSWRHTFAVTPSIPSYLVAIVVHDYDELNFKTPKGYEYSIIGPNRTLHYKCNVKQMDFIGVAIDYLMEKFKVDKYPFDKIDFIRLPFHPALGMENPGLITWRNYKFCIYGDYWQQVVLHELLHQWFGNIVTPVAWSDVVMSEGLTSYYTRVVYNEMNIIFGHLKRILPGQILSENDLPIINKPTDLDQKKYIGRRHYDKSAFLFQMMADLIGEETFDKAINIHLKFNENGWASFDQFLAIVNSVSTLNFDLGPIFKPYFTRTDYPVIFIRKVGNILEMTPVLVKDDNDAIFSNPAQLPINSSEYYVPVYYYSKYDKSAIHPILQVGSKYQFVSYPDIIVPYPVSYHRTCYVQPELWLLAARHVQRDYFWAWNMYLDFLVCTKNQSSPVFDEVLQVFLMQDRMAVPKNDHDEKWLKY
uniref:Peptidase_M1 domain-containing protein n=1 Tax=Panagrellus redivivus TaxID=6233 RepID=A0A7E4ZWW4_PANRE